MEQIQTELVKEFDPEYLKKMKNSTIAIIGKRGSGKTIALRHLLNVIAKEYKETFLFSETNQYQDFNYNFLPDSHRISRFDPDTIQELWDQQSNYIITNMKNYTGKNAEEYKKTLDHVLLIFDDCISNTRFRTTQIFDKLFTCGRHINLCVIVLSQVIGGKFGINSVCRQNMNFIITFNLESEYCQKTFVEQYLSFNSKKEGYEILREITGQKYQCIVIDNTVIGRDITQKVFKYTAKLVKSIKLSEYMEQLKSLNLKYSKKQNYNETITSL